MFKHIGLLVRKEGLTHDEFTNYWKETHADIAKQIEGLIRYQQVHAVDPESAPCDGLAELYFETFEDLTAALGIEEERDFDPELPNAAQARADASNFLEIGERPKIVGQEIVEYDEVGWKTDGLVKESIFFVRDEGLTHESFLERWESNYAPLVEKIPQLVRHARVVPNDPTVSEFDGVAEFYFEDLTDVPERFGIEGSSKSKKYEMGHSERIPFNAEVLPLESMRRFVGVEHIQKNDH